MWMFVLGALCGIAGCLYLLASIKKKKEQDTDAVKGVSVYLNFIILDKTVAIQSGVKEKMQSKMGRGFIRDKIASGIAKTAASRVSDEVVAKKMEVKIVEVLPGRLAAMGITAETKTVFVKGSLFVIRLTLCAVDLPVLLEKKMGQEKATSVDDILGLLGGDWIKNSLQTKLVPLICDKLQEKLPPTMMEKFQEKGVQMDVTVLPAHSEAEFFFETMEGIMSNAEPTSA